MSQSEYITLPPIYFLALQQPSLDTMQSLAIVNIPFQYQHLHIWLVHQRLVITEDLARGSKRKINLKALVNVNVTALMKAKAASQLR